MFKNFQKFKTLEQSRNSQHVLYIISQSKWMQTTILKDRPTLFEGQIKNLGRRNCPTLATGLNMPKEESRSCSIVDLSLVLMSF